MYIVLVNIFLILWATRCLGQMNAQNPYRVSLFQRSFPDFKKYIVPSIVAGFLAPDWRSDFIRQSLLWRSQMWDYRRFLFSSAQGIFSFFGLVLALVLFYEINSYLMVFLALLVLVLGTLKRNPFRRYFNSISPVMYFSLILFFIELSFRNSSLLMQFLTESELVYFTTIDSLGNILVLLAISTILGFALPIQGWSLVVTYLFFLNSQLSFLGFVFIVVGEFLGTWTFWALTVRKWDIYYRRRIQGLMVWILSYLILFLIGIYFWRQMISFGNLFNQLFMLKWLFIGTFVVFLSGLYLVVMTWGHFKSQSKDTDVAVTDNSLVSDFSSRPDEWIYLFVRKELEIRKSKLVEFKNELDRDPSSKAKIPPFVLNQFESEIKLIDSISKIV